MSNPKHPPKANLLTLPPELRTPIYTHLLTLPHPLHIFQDPELFAPAKPPAWLALIYTNRQISIEARAILYGAHQFIFEEIETARRLPSLVEAFLGCIGPVNAGYLSHVSINFPATERVDGLLGKVRIREDGLRRLDLLRGLCTGLKTLEVVVYGREVSGLLGEDQMEDRFVREVWVDVDRRVRGIGSLRKKMVRVCGGVIDPSVRGFLEGLGWVVLMGNL
ncbi:uncharacterized protein BO80DRAFT_426266 [Aspergillus ibericus CBS 121593]|uniref:Uncharacterized protein n=1 Tax=Aspergillus ibericus CBS 121593 TaxID=1448316 RepID=A0A395GXU7_9EURO|nr:hypothetical protein BO80DRAFT_426266 [Aspergillus ibericus CBS 121593]RAK99888.1 hypothetical protein BO80DRAFT_426266 [Aspergillus ibericus CBS 121593]